MSSYLVIKLAKSLTFTALLSAFSKSSAYMYLIGMAYYKKLSGVWSGAWSGVWSGVKSGVDSGV